MQRTVTDRGGIEPPLAFGADGALFFSSAVTGASYPATSTTVLFRSDDQGKTWVENVPQMAGVEFNEKGIDPYLYRDSLTGRLFYILYFQLGTHIAWTDDEGATWGRPLHGRINDPATTTDYPKLWTSRPASGGLTPAGASFYVHLCYNAGLSLNCQRSIDGGLTFHPSPSPYPDVPRDYAQTGCADSLPGWTISSPEDGTIYMAKRYCWDQEVAISRDNGLTWERVVVAEDVAGEGTVTSEGRLAIDGKGNLYYLWMNDGGDFLGGRTAVLSISRDGGETWSEPIDVGAPGVTAVKYPSIVAGDGGRIAFFYLGSKVPGGWNASEEAMNHARWDGYVGFSLDALSERPVFATAMVNPVNDPLRRGPCEVRCSPDPDDCGTLGCDWSSPISGIFDYLQLALDPTSGRVAVSLVDLCAGKCGTAAGTSEDPWSQFGAVGVQVSGPSLLKVPKS